LSDCILPGHFGINARSAPGFSDRLNPKIISVAGFAQVLDFQYACCPHRKLRDRIACTENRDFKGIRAAFLD